jgi:hypothetical protein
VFVVKKEKNKPLFDITGLFFLQAYCRLLFDVIATAIFDDRIDSI